MAAKEPTKRRRMLRVALVCFALSLITTAGLMMLREVVDTAVGAAMTIG